MKYLLDTNTCIRYLNGRAPSVVTKVLTTNPQDIVLCSVVKAELFFGGMRSINPTQSIATQQRFVNRFVSLPFDDNAATFYAQIRADLTSKGTPIGPNDYMIAAIALAHGLILVTHNTKEFGRISTLLLEDWEIP